MDTIHNGRKFTPDELWRMRGNLDLALASLKAFLGQNTIYKKDSKLVACRQLLTGVASDLAPKEGS
jgi:hypothetical protein